MKRILTIGVCLLLAALIALFVYFKGKRYEIIVPQAKIDSALSEKFPATEDFLFIFNLTYSNPQVTLLQNDNRVQVGLDASLDIKIDGELESLGGGATVTAGLRYDQETQEFFLDNAEIERLEIQGVPDEWLEKVTKFASTAARNFVESGPVYSLEARDAKTTTAKLLLKDFEVREQAIHVTLGL